MRVAYAKIGRSWSLGGDKSTVTSGDVDVRRALLRLARANPEHEFFLAGKNSAERADWLPDNVVNPWPVVGPQIKRVLAESKKFSITEERHAFIIKNAYEPILVPLFQDVDAIVVWAGQHGTHNSTIPLLKTDGMSTAHDSFLMYAGWIIRGINEWRDRDPHGREEIWLCPDPRNTIKCRDLKWPLQHVVLAQYDDRRNMKHYRYGDRTRQPEEFCAEDAEPGVWKSKGEYGYAAVELTALPTPAETLDLFMARPQLHQRQPFGMIVNENRKNVSRNRLDIIKQWVLSECPDAEIFGKWSAESVTAMGRSFIKECPYQYLPQVTQRWVSTLTTPASGSGWATAKPWECFAYGTVCFFHPEYDTQGHILRSAPDELREFLRVSTPEEMWKRVKQLHSDYDLYVNIIAHQREHYERMFEHWRGGILSVERRLGV